jgi:hypothetical protein
MQLVVINERSEEAFAPLGNDMVRRLAAPVEIAR